MVESELVQELQRVRKVALSKREETRPRIEKILADFSSKVMGQSVVGTVIDECLRAERRLQNDVLVDLQEYIHAELMAWPEFRLKAANVLREAVESYGLKLVFDQPFDEKTTAFLIELTY
ncbi:MAG: hypothetical protein AAB965_01410 [Patescibacteria group bacterium]